MAGDIEASTSETASDHQSPNIENSTSGGDIEASTSEMTSDHQSPNIESSTSGAKQFEELDDINLTGVGSDMGVIISKGNKGNNPINFKAHFKKELRQWEDIDRRFAQNIQTIEASTSETASDIEASTSETASGHQSPNIENSTSGAKQFEELDEINLTGVGSNLGVIISNGNKGNNPINFKEHFKKELRQWEDIDRRFAQNFPTIEASTSETAGDIEASTSETASDYQSPNIENNTSGAKQFEELDDINLTGVGSHLGVIILKGNKGNSPINFKAHFKKELKQWEDIDRRFAQNFQTIEASTSETAGDIEASTS
ncbi:hypothetical protein KIW84_056213 [Lathyrus oleraceus]|uniref:Uncharacterized protein n=1 Tax=Pisum sativum TaxID=3888 RepID=A0A9D4WZV5_PEA|nr:hypothetical protein KIW84_056213 [Pisum sativum]